MSVFRVGSNKSSVNNFPSVRPTLDLDFANSKTLDPRITFTRASGGSYVGADGLIKLAGVNEARFDHDPYTGESLGLLIEEPRTNLLKYSNSFSTGGGGNWTPVSTTCVFTQNVTGPDGVVNGAWTIDDQFTGSDGSGFEQSLSITPSASTNYCLSVFVKKGTATYFDFFAFFTGSSTKGTVFRYNFSTNTINVSSADGGGISPTIFGKIEYPNGWYRLYFVVSDANSGLNNALQYRIYPASRDLGLTGTTLFYGAQVESGAFPTSYIPTVGSTRTRAADSASITGKNFSEWYRQDEGTVFSSFYPNTISTSSLGHFVFSFTDGTSSGTTQNTLNLLKRANIDFSTRFSSISSSGTNTSFINVGTWSTNKTNISSSYKENNFAAVKNGSTVLNNNLVNMPVNITIFHIGSRFGNSYLNGTISRLTYFPKRLPDAQLQALTK